MAERVQRRGRSAQELAERVVRGDGRALSQLITAVEDGRQDAREALRGLYGRTGNAHIVGITGPPGSGKSTLTLELAREYRARGHLVGIVAVDPSSPFSGGAILGDRIRMMELHADPGVFVRSMATRGMLGGLARSTTEIVAVLDAFGKDVVLVETVGIGQDEVDIARAADTTLVVGVPGLGDDIQAIKAGVLEIADIFVVNKADLPGARQLVHELRAMQQLRPASAVWQPPIVETVASRGQGVAALVDAIAAHQAAGRASGAREVRRTDVARRHVRALVEQHLRERFERQVDRDGWSARFEAVAAREQDPYTAADEILAGMTASLVGDTR